MIVMRIKKLFFDKSPVMKAFDRGARKVFNRFGGAVRLTARRSMKAASKKRSVSDPGSPPLTHTKVLKDKIKYAADARGVVIGPELASVKGKPAGSKTIPQAIEEGGTIIVLRGKKSRVDRKVQIRARPYMQPAFDKILPSLMKMWSDVMG